MAAYLRRALTPGNAQHLRDQYDAGLRQTDDELGAFLATLESRGELTDTAVVITSDHGEELLDHGLVGHELSLYREVLMVPFVVAGPGVRAGRIAWPAGLVDVTPTLLGLLGEPVPGAMQGRDLSAMLRSQDLDERRQAEASARISELHRDRALSSVLSGDHHLIVDRQTGRAELYDLGVDRAEQHDVAAESAAAVAELNRALAEHDAAGADRRSPERIGVIGADVEQRLRALGYVPP
jgi:arylsulfatase A-like enzyme